MALPTISNNSPSAGYISWTQFGISYNGVAYTVAASNTAESFVIWKYNNGSPTTLKTSVFPGDLTADDQILFLNKSGVGALVPMTDVLDGSLVVPGSIIANAIASNTIQTYHINANAVNAIHIQSNSITSNELASNSVTAEHLGVGTVGDSLVTNGYFEEIRNGLPTGWFGDAAGTAGTVTPVTGVSTSGNNAVRLLCPAITDKIYLKQTSAKFIPVTATSGRSWYISAKIGAGAVLTKGLSVRAVWYDAAKAYVGYTNLVNAADGVTLSNVGVTNTFDVYEGQVVPTSTAKYMAIEISVQLPDVANVSVYVDEVMAREVVVSAVIGDGQISTPKVAANAIVANHIASNVIQANHIVGGSITADKLLISKGGNLLTDPDFADVGTGGWTSPSSAISYGGAGTGYSGGSSLLIGTSASQQFSYYGLADPKRRTKIVPGSPYRVSAWVRPGADAPVGSIGFSLRAYNDITDAYVFGSGAAGTANNDAILPANIWTRVSIVFNIPDGAYHSAAVALVKQAAFSTAAVRFSDPSLQAATAGELIVDGTIESVHVKANSINADRIISNTISANKISTNAITGNHIGFNVITGDMLNVNAITAKHIGFNVLTGSMINVNTITAKHIGFNVITGDMLNVNAITAKHIGFNTLTGEMINANVITGKHIGFNVITGDMIQSNTITSNEIGANAITSKHIGAGSISAKQLLVGSATNGLADPGFANAEIMAGRFARSTGTWTQNIVANTATPSVWHTTTTTNDQFHYSTITPVAGNAGNAIQVSKGQKWYMAVDVSTDISAGVRWNVYKYLADGTVTYASLSPYSTDIGTRELAYTYTIPDGVIAVDFALACNTAGVKWTVYGNGVVARQSTSTLIEDGAILTNLIGANAIVSNKIATNAITANHINVNSITAVHIQSNAITTNEIHINAITGKNITGGTVTGATVIGGEVKTSATANAVIARMGPSAVTESDTTTLRPGIGFTKVGSVDSAGGMYSTDGANVIFTQGGNVAAGNIATVRVGGNAVDLDAWGAVNIDGRASVNITSSVGPVNLNGDVKVNGASIFSKYHYATITQTGVPSATTWGVGTPTVSGLSYVTAPSMVTWGTDTATFAEAGYYSVLWNMNLSAGVTGRTFLSLESPGGTIYARASMGVGEDYGTVAAPGFYVAAAGQVVFRYYHTSSGSRTATHAIRMMRVG